MHLSAFPSIQRSHWRPLLFVGNMFFYDLKMVWQKMLHLGFHIVMNSEATGVVCLNTLKHWAEVRNQEYGILNAL